MTYCFAFSAEPDGIAVISDTRVTFEMAGELQVDHGDYLKVLSPKENSLIAVSGGVFELKLLLDELLGAIENVSAARQFDAVHEFLKTRYSKIFSALTAYKKSIRPMSLIYGDIRHKRGSTKCRLAKYDFRVINGRPAIGFTMGGKFGWFAIGWSQDGRRLLSQAAIENLSEIESRSLRVYEPSSKQNKTLYKSHNIENSAPYSAFIFDSNGQRDGSFRKTLRQFANNFEANKEANVKLEPMLIMGGTAKNAIEHAMLDARTKGIPDSEAVGTNWTLATLTRRFGYRVHSSSDLQLVPLI